MTISGEQQIIMYPVKQYIWGADRVLTQIDNLTGKIYYYLYNGHGDVVRMTDTAGNIVNSYDYDVWGDFLQREAINQCEYFYTFFTVLRLIGQGVRTDKRRRSLQLMQECYKN